MMKLKKNQSHKKSRKKNPSQLELTRLTCYLRYKIKITQLKRKVEQTMKSMA